MFLGRKEIEVRIDRERLIELLDRKRNLKAANLDLRVGNEVYISGANAPTALSDVQPYVVLEPGQFALVTTFEKIKMPYDLIGLISIRSRFKMKGLVNISGFHVDPNFEGPLIFAVQNVGPNNISLRYKDEAFMLMLAEVKSPEKPTTEELNERKGPPRITLDQMAQLGGATVTIDKLRGQIRSLEVQLKIYGALIIAVLAGILIELLRGKG